MTWEDLSKKERAAARRLVRIAARRSALGRPWSPWCINAPAELGMTPEAIRAEWAAAGNRAAHLAAVLKRRTNADK